MRSRHITAWGPRMKVKDAFPREVTLQFRNLAHFLNNSDVFESLDFPSIKPATKITKETTRTDDGGHFYTGKAYCKILIETEAELQEAKVWAENSCTEEFRIGELTFYSRIPSILNCSFCAYHNKEATGHHEKYCYVKKKTNSAPRSPAEKLSVKITKETELRVETTEETIEAPQATERFNKTEEGSAPEPEDPQPVDLVCDHGSFNVVED